MPRKFWVNCMATLKHIASKNSDYTAIEAYRIRSHRDMYVHYLEGIQQDLDRKEEKGGDSE